MLLRISDVLTSMPVIGLWAMLTYKLNSKKQVKSGKGSVFQAMFTAALFSAVVYSFSKLVLVVLKASAGPGQEKYLEMLLHNNLCNLFIYLIFVGYKLYSGYKTEQRALFVPVITCILAVGQILYYYYLFLSDPGKFTGWIMGLVNLCCMVILFVHGTVLELMERITKDQKKQNETASRMLEKKYEYDYYMLGKEQSENVRKIRMEMWEQLKTVQRLLHNKEKTKEQAQTMLEQMEEKVNRMGWGYYCNDTVLNTMLALKHETAQKQGIDMEITVESMIPTAMEDIDLCCIVTNLLDNAIESTARITEKEDKTIHVQVGQRGGYQMIQVENPTKEMPKKNKKGIYLSSKKDDDKNREHGRGLGIVEKTAQKYNGYTDFEVIDQKVIVTVFIQGKKTDDNRKSGEQ